MLDSPFDICALVAPFLPENGQALAVGVSGGPDSMALCHALSQVSPGPVHAITVDHGLRPEAPAEARQVAAWLSGWPQVRHEAITRDAPDEGSGRIQEAARHDRYRLLAGYCEKRGIGRLFTAHHQDDQAETFLFRLAKGSGLDGLGAIRPVHAYGSALLLVRPLLEVPKSALLDYCRAHDVPYISDPSNNDEHFARARLRGSYDVLAAEGLTPKRLAVTAARLARAREALEVTAARLYEQALVSGDASRIELDFHAMTAQPEELRLRVLTAAITALAGPRAYPPRLERLEDLAEKVFSDTEFKRASLAGCLIGLTPKKDRIVIEREQDSPKSD